MFSVDSDGEVRIGGQPRLPSTGWGDITVELLDKILEYLPHRNDVLNIRVVNKHWNSVTKSVLTRRTLQQWTLWRPFVNFSRISPYPVLDLAPGMLSTWSKADYDYFSNIFVVPNSNPFPNSSLDLRHLPRLIFSLQDMIEEMLHKLLLLQGHNLVSLKLVVKEITTARFYRILEQVPNLKAFTLAVKGRARDLPGRTKCIMDGEELPLSPCPQLTHLRICQGSSDSSVLVQWLLKLFSPQLISLEMDSNKVLPLEPENYPAGAFQNLKRLAIRYPPTLDFLMSGTTFQWRVQFLSLQILGPPKVPIEGLMQFIDNFSGSLAHLYLYVEDFEHSGETTDILDEAGGEIIFPRLSKFAVNHVKRQHVIELISKHFAPRFRNLRVLQLLDFHWGPLYKYDAPIGELITEAAEFSESAGFWKNFPKLDTIEIHPFQLANPCEGKFYVLNRIN